MELKHLNEQEFNTVKNGTKPAMIDFFATWCGPCKMLGPVMEQLADRYDGKAVVAKVDVDEQQMLAIQYGVMSVPTVLFLKNGEEVGRPGRRFPPSPASASPVWTRPLTA